jgi:hypothetical protein
MRSRTMAVAVVAAIVSLGLWGWGGASAYSVTVCTWAGTPAEPTGTFSLKPGLTTTPSAGPLKFSATGPLGGGCKGKMTFVGVFNAGSSCALGTFEGKVKGLPGVARFAGAGNVLAPSVLFDSAGNAVSSEHPQLVTGVGSGSEAGDCLTPEGFTHGSFSSVLEFSS